MIVNLACIVEGHGEQESARILVQRLCRIIRPELVLRIPIVLRVSRSRLVKPGEIERSVEIASRKVGPGGPVLILLDSDDDCPARLAPALLQRARSARSDRKISVVLAKREFEAWFLAAARSLRGLRGLAENLEPPPEPEEIRGAKEWLTRHKVDGTAYSSVLDQPKLTDAFDLTAARGAASFDKLHRDMSTLLAD